MKSERKAFLPIGGDVDDDKLERLAQQKGVGRFEKPAPAKEVRAGEEHTSIASAPSALPAAATCKIHFDGPEYLSTELRIAAATKRTTVRYIILKALKDAGFDIRDGDLLEDGRRDRPSKPAALA